MKLSRFKKLESQLCEFYNCLHGDIGVLCVKTHDLEADVRELKLLGDSSIDKIKLKNIRKAIQQIIDYPPKESGRRTKDGYPTEFTFDEFAYRRMVDSYRGVLKAILEESE